MLLLLLLMMMLLMLTLMSRAHCKWHLRAQECRVMCRVWSCRVGELPACLRQPDKLYLLIPHSHRLRPFRSLHTLTHTLSLSLGYPLTLFTLCALTCKSLGVIKSKRHPCVLFILFLFCWYLFWWCISHTFAHTSSAVQMCFFCFLFLAKSYNFAGR